MPYLALHTRGNVLDMGEGVAYTILDSNPNKGVAIASDNGAQVLVPLTGAIPASMDPHHYGEVRLVLRRVNAEEETILVPSIVAIGRVADACCW